MRTSIVPTFDLDAVNAVFGSASPQRIVRWAANEFGDGLIMSSSFGVESAALLHLATRIMPGIRVVMIDTGYLFNETLEFMEALSARFDLNLLVYRSRQDPIQYLRDAKEHDPSVRKNVDACCAANKNEPFDRAMRELAPLAWLRGIRRDQSITRADRSIVEWSGRYDSYAISPLLNWSTAEVHEYMRANDLPFHPLYEKGYQSIGCNPHSCTRPVLPGEGARAGRWSSLDKTECGLHLERALYSQ